MRKILVDLSQDRQDAVHLFGGFEGEHNATFLSVILPERMKNKSDGEYRFVFETAKKEVIFSAPIEPQDGVLSVSLVKHLMLAPHLVVYVGCYRYENGATVQIAKSGQIVLGIKNPEDGEVAEWDGEGGCVPGIVMEDSILEDSKNPVKSSAIAAAFKEKVPFSHITNQVGTAKEAGDKLPTEKAVAERLEDFVLREEFDENVLSVGNEVYTTKEEMSEFDAAAKRSFASALQASVSGNPLRLDDVSCLPHRIKVEMTSEPYRQGSLIIRKGQNSTYNLENDGYYTVLGTSSQEENGELLSVTVLFSADPLLIGMVASLSAGASAEELLNLNSLKEGDVVWYSTGVNDVAGLYYGEKVSKDIKKYGKNLIPYPYSGKSVTTNGMTFTVNGDGSITLNGTATFDTSFHLATSIPLRAGTTYYMSDSGTGIITIAYTKSNGTNDRIFANKFTWNKDYVFNSLYLHVPAGKTFENATIFPMLELGEAASEYEPYKEPVTYTADENGIVNDVTSVCPTTTLVADDGVTIAAEYNKDTNKVISEIRKNLIQNKSILSNVANALRCDTRGTMVRLDDVSPLEHEMNVKTYGADKFIAGSDTSFAWVEKEGFYTVEQTVETDEDFQIYFVGGEKWIVGFQELAFDTLEIVRAIKKGDILYNKFMEVDDTGFVFCDLYTTSGKSVTVNKFGKNLFDSSLLLQAKDWADENGYYHGNPNDLYTKYSKDKNSLFDGFLPNTQYTLSFKGFASESNLNGSAGFLFKYSDGTYSESVRVTKTTEETFSITTEAGKTVVGLHATYSVNHESYFKDIQLEVGTTATDYEPYKGTIAYTADENGNVKGVTSLYPTTTLIAADEGTTITAEYNKDINKAVNDIYQKLSALSAAVVNNG